MSKPTYRVTLRTTTGTVTEAPLPFVLDPENTVPWTEALALDFAHGAFRDEPTGTTLIIERRRGEGKWTTSRRYVVDGGTILQLDPA